MAEVMVGDQVLVQATALRVIEGVGVLVEMFSKTDRYEGWIREDLVHLPEKTTDLADEPADGTTLMGDIDPETGNGSVFRRDDAEGHFHPDRRCQQVWWDYAASEWIDWPEAVRRGANPGRRLTEEPAAGGQRRLPRGWTRGVGQGRMWLHLA